MSLFQKFQSRYFNFSFRNILLFLVTWLLTGYSLGTITLLFPLRWIVNFCKSLQFSEAIEELSVDVIIVLFVIASFFISLLITKKIIIKKSLLFSASSLFILLLITLGFTWLWMNPELTQMGSKKITEENIGKVQFMFGAYPSAPDLLRLKDEGYTAVISLLHPAVVPFEPKLLADEKKEANLIGLKFINIPMLPWVSENKSSIEEIKNIAQTGTGKYYVHCYLGKDRVNVVKRIVHQFCTNIKDDEISERKFSDISSFERGKIIEFDNDKFLSPLPTDDEYFGFVLNGNVKKIVSLLDPDNPPDTLWINKEQKILKANLMPYELMPIKLEPYDANNVLKIVEKVKHISEPVLVHGFLTNSPQTNAFITAYKTGLPSLPPELFQQQLQKGKTSLIAPNILIGPNPTKTEFKKYLFYKGIRTVFYIGNERLASAIYDKLAASDAGLKWFASAVVNQDVIEMLKNGGPWYVYGLSNEAMVRLIQAPIDDDGLLNVSN